MWVFSFSFVLKQKKKKQKEKFKAERLRGYSGKAVLVLKKELAPFLFAQTAFFSAPPVHSSAHAPPPRPVF